jgi:hypothetical protein
MAGRAESSDAHQAERSMDLPGRNRYEVDAILPDRQAVAIEVGHRNLIFILAFDCTHQCIVAGREAIANLCGAATGLTGPRPKFSESGGSLRTEGRDDQNK